jgi:pectate lyase
MSTINQFHTFIKAVGLTSVFIGMPAMATAEISSPGSAQLEYHWAGPDSETSGWIDTGRGFLGWIWQGVPGSGWVYNLKLNRFIYCPASPEFGTGVWMYVTDWSGIDLYLDPLPGFYYYVYPLGAWIQAESEISEGEGSWAYIWNVAGTIEPVKPADIVVDSRYVADFDAPDPTARYADALWYSANELYPVIRRDSDIEVRFGFVEEGITFTSTALSWQGNRFIRIGFDSDEGLFDLSALEGISGTIRAFLHADVDLSGSANGFYVRLKRDHEDVAAYARLDAGTVQEDMLLETYVTNHEEDVYMEITLPWGGKVTVKNVILHMEDKVRGFADMEESITGGEGASEDNTFLVTNEQELLSALEAVEGLAEPAIIRVDGTLTYEDWVAVSGDDARQIDLGGDFSDLTIIGVEDRALFDGVGFQVQGNNIIFQNITIRYVLGRDAITINNATYVKVTHSTFYNESMEVNTDKDKYDEIFGIKNNTQHVILSWNHIYDSHKTILVGSNDGLDALPDRRLVVHHNYFHDCGSRLPLFRGGHAHVYNNYFLRCDSAVNTRTNSKMLIENNFFEDVGRAIGYYFDESNPSGLIEVRGNIYVDVGGDTPSESTVDIEFEGDYSYTLDPAEEVPGIVTTLAGAGVTP